MSTPIHLKQVLSQLNSQQPISVPYLAEALHFSESTIRRILKKLEQEQLITLVRGGAILNSYYGSEAPVAVRQSQNRVLKKAIACEAAKLVQDNQVLFVDASSTAQEIIPYLKSKRNLTIVTPCMPFIQRAALELDCILICPGGKLHKPTASFVGIDAINALSNWFADIMFFSCAAIDAAHGMTDESNDFSQIQTAMIHHSKLSVLLIDSTKFGRTAAYRVPIEKVDKIITNADPPIDSEEWKKYISKMVFV